MHKIKCPNCGKEATLKKAEDYKLFFICNNESCYIVSIILTTTEKYSDKIKEIKKLNDKRVEIHG